MDTLMCKNSANYGSNKMKIYTIEKVSNILVFADGGSISKVLRTAGVDATASAFVQQRNKIPYTVFEDAMETRTIPMLESVYEAFLEEKKYQEEVGLKCSVVIDGYANFIFVNRFGATQHHGRKSPQAFSFCWCKILRVCYNTGKIVCPVRKRHPGEMRKEYRRQMAATNLSETITAAGNAGAEYDANMKRLLADKQILARILKYTVTEFRDMEPEAVMACIRDDIEIGTPLLIRGSQTLGVSEEDLPRIMCRGKG